MKMNKKKVVVASLAVSLIAILSFGTIAWFSAEDDVTNKFKVATSSQDPDDIFSVDVMEQVDSDGDGTYDMTLDDGDVPNGGFTYENILPGDDLGKKPWVKNTGSYDQYIRVKVTVDNADQWKEIVTNYPELADLSVIFKGHNESLWTRSEIIEENNKLTYVYYLNKILKPDASEYLFTSVVIPEKITQDDMATFTQGMFTLDIVAEAVQTENVVPNDVKATNTAANNEAANAIIAFKTVMGN